MFNSDLKENIKITNRCKLIIFMSKPPLLIFLNWEPVAKVMTILFTCKCRFTILHFLAKKGGNC